MASQPTPPEVPSPLEVRLFKGADYPSVSPNVQAVNGSIGEVDDLPFEPLLNHW